MNRKRIIIPALVAVAMAALAFRIAHYALYRQPGISLDCLYDLSFLTQELGLSDTQAGEIAPLNTTLGTRLNDGCMRHCAARARLGHALAADTNGSAQADIVLNEMCRAYAESERATLDHIRAVRAVLNPAQRQQFDTMISACMCKPCRMPGGSCRADADDMAPTESPTARKETKK